MRPLRGATLAALLAVTLLLSGCVSVPTSGRVERVEGPQQSCQNCVNIEVAPPSPGDDPRQVVEGFLGANADYQPNYSVARQFLTAAAAQKWSPEDGVTIYSGSPTAAGDRVTLAAQVVGQLSRDRAYTARNDRVAVDFGLVREGGEWRISTPPAGLMVAEFRFARFYSSYDLYFVGNGSVLVPDPIYLPRLRNQANVASALVKALLNGPTSWLAPAVTTAVPRDTTLSMDSVTITDGVASVPLSDSVLALSDPQRSLLSAQILYTLKQAVAVRGVLITVNQQSFRVPEGDPSTFVVSTEAIPADREPVSPVVGDQLYVVRNRAVQRFDPTSSATTPVAGDLGSGKVRVDSLAVSVTDTDLAAVVDGGTRLVQTETTTPQSQSKTVLAGASRLLRPQFTRYGELWVVGQYRGRQRVWLSTGAGAAEISAPALNGRNVVAFRISPDGTRMALVERTPTGDRLVVARIDRGDKVTVDGERPLDTTRVGSPTLRRLNDVAWVDATDLLVLGATSAKDAASPYSVSEDASVIVDQGEALDWDPATVTVLLRTQSAVVLSKNQQTWRDQGSTWQPLVDKVGAVAYPG